MGSILLYIGGGGGGGAAHYIEAQLTKLGATYWGREDTPYTSPTMGNSAKSVFLKTKSNISTPLAFFKSAFVA